MGFTQSRLLLVALTFAWGLDSIPFQAAQAQNAQAQNAQVTNSRGPANFAPQLLQNVVFLAWQGNQDVQGCGVCHYSPGNPFAQRKTDFCKLTEIEQWLKTDKHAIARQRVEPIAEKDRERALERVSQMLKQRGGSSGVPSDWIGPSNFLSFAICEQLGYDIKSEDGYGQFRENCLTCHAGYEAEKGPQGFTRDVTNHPGISCNYCHQVGVDRRWIDQHSSLDAEAKWRLLPPEAKSEKGMRNLTSSRSQVDLCYRCHIGDIQRNAFVTHQMYSAGHPPLPSVELDRLVENMPRHWRDNRELFESLTASSYSGRDVYFQINFPVEFSALKKDVDKMYWHSSALLTGALAADQQWLKLIIQSTSSQSNHLADYGLYDCAACHHELRTPSDRQRIRLESGGKNIGSPGRPRLLEWPQAISNAVAVAAGEQSAIQPLKDRLKHSVASRPFGEPTAMGTGADALSREIEQLQSRILRSSQDPSFLRRVMSQLAQSPDELLVDYHAARQINWALRCIDSELALTGNALPREVRDRIAHLGTGLEPLSIRVSTKLPGGLSQPIYPGFVDEELKRQADYDFQLFKNQLRQIADSLSKT